MISDSRETPCEERHPIKGVQCDRSLEEHRRDNFAPKRRHWYSIYGGPNDGDFNGVPIDYVEWWTDNSQPLPQSGESGDSE